MYNFLLIEDSAEDSDSFKDTVKRLNLQANEEVYHLDVAETYEEGMKKVSENLNGIIVDIKLDGGHSGNEIIREIVERFRVPVAIFTGTPDTELAKDSPIQVYKKGEAKHEEILKELCDTWDTGLFDVLGGTGIIEKAMTKIFWENLYPQINLWKEKKSQGIETEKVLLRYAVSHIQELIDNEVPAYVTEEMYIKPPISPDIKTGSIFQSSKMGLSCIVLSPPCDLAQHNGKFKTNRILVCEIDDHDTVNNSFADKSKKPDHRKKDIEDAIKNNSTSYYHWLPQNTLFEGGYINFRKVITYSPEEFIKKFGNPKVKVQEYFVKNILNRFSAYYARQGQPDFNFKVEAKAIYDKIVSTEENKK
ncbi:response regulator [Blautia sp.]